jgi:hypothetical protein
MESNHAPRPGKAEISSQARDKAAAAQASLRRFRPFEGEIGGSALARLEAPLGLVDHVNAAFAAHDTVVAVTPPQRFQ